MKQRVVINDKVHLYRWTLLRCRWFQVVLHNVRSDDPPDLHDHAWWNVSIVLRGVLKETTYKPAPFLQLPAYCSRYLRAPCVRIRSATELHRLSVVRGPVWTLFITGPVQRDWGYDTEAGWVPWQRYPVKHNTLRRKNVK
jgi:hypothetical protein